MANGQRRGRCPACRESAPLERHHILPRRFFGTGRHNDHIVCLCSACHREVEITINRRERYRGGELTVTEYFVIVAKLIKEKNYGPV